MSTATETTTVLNNHVTIRAFTDQNVPDEMVNAILDAARRSPTSSNMQTYSIVVVRNQETKKKLAVMAGNQKHIETCPVFFAFCADISRLEAACAMHGEKLVRGLETTLVSSVDAALVGMSANTAAESFGLGVVMIGGMRNHPQQAAELLGLPDGSYVVYGMCIGYAEESQIPDQKPRLPRDLVVHYEKYSEADPTSLLEQHDQELANHYNAQGRNLDAAAWTGPIAKRLNAPRRTNLRPELEQLGFKFE
ncbi:MAG: NADPH-dependent oxidoreductase [Chloroflexota bacterium]